MAQVALSSIVEKGMERVMGRVSTPEHGISYVEKGSAVVANTATGFIIPTKLRELDMIQIVGTNAYAKVAFFTTVVGWTLDSTNPVVRAAACQAGGTTGTIKLDSSASAIDDLYNGLYGILKYADGTTAEFKVTDYDGTTKIATVVNTRAGVSALPAAPGASDEFEIYGIQITCTDPGNAAGASFIWKSEGKI